VGTIYYNNRAFVGFVFCINFPILQDHNPIIYARNDQVRSHSYLCWFGSESGTKLVSLTIT